MILDGNCDGVVVITGGTGVVTVIVALPLICGGVLLVADAVAIFV